MKKHRFKAPSGATLNFTEMGLGGAPLGNLFKAISHEESQNTLESAWQLGIRYFDTSPLYGLGLSETRLNPFLASKKRSAFLISTKVGRLLQPCAPQDRTGIGKYLNTPNRRQIYDYSYDGIMRSLEFSLERLGLDHVDILLVHDVDVFTHGTVALRDQHVHTLMSSGYKALVKLREEGVVKAVGAGVNEWQVCETLLKAGDFDLFLLAGRYTLLEQEALNSFLPLCQARGVGIVLGGPYNSGILATGAKKGAVYNYDPAPAPIMERVAKIEKLCKAFGVKLSEAALRFPLMHPCVVSVIPGANSARQVQLNVQTLDQKIPRELWKALKNAGLMEALAPIRT
jgi:D-threo-aldose 1-dehydrogenase